MEMQYENKISYEVWGDYALFSDPLGRVGGEKCSYPVPTYQALIGVTESIYWKPTLIWYIDRVRVMNPIRMQTKGVKTLRYAKEKNDLSFYTYLSNVRYQVEAHFEWNLNRPQLERDRNENKHFQIASRSLKRGGRRDIFLGTRECQGYVGPCEFGESSGAYDEMDRLTFGVMFHGFNYPDDTGRDELEVRLWNPVLNKGILYFPRPERCELIRKVKKNAQSEFLIGRNCSPVEDSLVEEG